MKLNRTTLRTVDILKMVLKSRMVLHWMRSVRS